MRKEYFETTLPARLEKFSALLKGPFFMGDKVIYKKIVFVRKKKNRIQPWVGRGVEGVAEAGSAVGHTVTRNYNLMSGSRVRLLPDEPLVLTLKILRGTLKNTVLYRA